MKVIGELLPRPSGLVITKNARNGVIHCNLGLSGGISVLWELDSRNPSSGWFVGNTEVIKIWLAGGAKGNRRSFTALHSLQDDKRVEEMAAQLIRDDW